jgi:hypothetical protein
MLFKAFPSETNCLFSLFLLADLALLAQPLPQRPSGVYQIGELQARS